MKEILVENAGYIYSQKKTVSRHLQSKMQKIHKRVISFYLSFVHNCGYQPYLQIILGCSNLWIV